MLKAEKAKLFAEEGLSKMEQNVKELTEAEELLNKQLDQTQVKLRSETLKNDTLTEVTQGLASLHEKMKVGFQPIESTLSCLSCLEYLSEPNPHTLVCGHSICGKVSKPYYNQFSIPTIGKVIQANDSESMAEMVAQAPLPSDLSLLTFLVFLGA